MISTVGLILTALLMILLLASIRRPTARVSGLIATGFGLLAFIDLVSGWPAHLVIDAALALLTTWTWWTRRRQEAEQ